MKKILNLLLQKVTRRNVGDRSLSLRRFDFLQIQLDACSTWEQLLKVDKMTNLLLSDFDRRQPEFIVFRAAQRLRESEFSWPSLRFRPVEDAELNVSQQYFINGRKSE